MKRLLPILKIVVTLAALFFIVRAVVRNASALRAMTVDLHPWPVILALLCSVLTSVLISVLWTAVVRPGWPFDRRFNFAYAKANLIRYIPGNVLGLGARVLFANRLGIPKKDGSLSIAIEGILLMLTAGALSFLWLRPWLTPVAIIGCLAVVWLLSRNFRHRSPVPPPRSAVAIATAYLGYGLGLGIALFSLARASSVSIGFTTAIGVFSLAWFLGYASLLTPSGLGVREGTIVLFLAPMIGTVPATFLAIGSRLAIIVSEVLVCTLYWFLNQKTPSSTTSPTSEAPATAPQQ